MFGCFRHVPTRGHALACALALFAFVGFIHTGSASETLAGKPEKLADTVSIVIAGDLVATPHLLLASTRAIAAQVLPNGIHSLDVVVVDTGATSGKHLVPSAVGEEDLHAIVNANGKLPVYATVRYHHLAYASLPEARQFGLTLATGAYIVLWDLFSVHAANRLQTQVAPLMAEQVRDPRFFVIVHCCNLHTHPSRRLLSTYCTCVTCRLTSRSLRLTRCTTCTLTRFTM
jgi:hypothetical protein